jgi:hypothetical protein
VAGSAAEGLISGDGLEAGGRISATALVAVARILAVGLEAWDGRTLAAVQGVPGAATFLVAPAVVDDQILVRDPVSVARGTSATAPASMAVEAFQPCLPLAPISVVARELVAVEASRTCLPLVPEPRLVQVSETAWAIGPARFQVWETSGRAPADLPAIFRPQSDERP